MTWIYQDRASQELCQKCYSRFCWLASVSPSDLQCNLCQYIVDQPPETNNVTTSCVPLVWRVALMVILPCRKVEASTFAKRYPHEKSKRKSGIEALTCLSISLWSRSVAKLSQKFKWRSWVICNHRYCQDVAETNKTDWSKVDAGLHAQMLQWHG